MRKIINSTYVTVDGVIERPQDWPSLGSADDGGVAIQTELLQACDILIMGRRTYEVFAASWPTRSGDPYSDRINRMAKYVVSTTLEKAEWTNTSVIGDDVVAAIQRLKEEPGQDIVQYGFGRLSHTLLDHGLLDEVRLWVHPFFLRRGGPQDLIFREGAPAMLNLVDTQPLKSGTVILSYRPRT
jgi:dihydrofolate reductase